ncbi:DUF742 domain-containing protein [Kitasatospora sp. NBC_01287]|uniref:DUF742 domain-containing protein n=1 Tax=Kitasatospora sp. NBC_01287 TaxID=2903573 RepID=UPI0022575ECD|nr:DUF742 domain-containing protein [Kitasatospora sp. NBC_01287]MCX4746619.1 DUF742 domain-containing protein [Kitasatospora sp. NBC_01287]
MTSPDDRQGQYGVPYPGTGHDAFGTPGAGHGQSYGRAQYGQYGASYGRPLPQQDPQAARAHQGPQAPEDEMDSGPLIRPFAMTGGRTRPRYELALEALVSASVDQARLATLLPEHQRICTLCATEVKSVAEVSALLSLPLGVARILVADLAEAGLVAIHQPAAGGESGNQPDVTLLERVLSGLRKL